MTVLCFDEDWPKCCGYTMTLDSPKEQRRFEQADQAAMKEQDGE